MPEDRRFVTMGLCLGWGLLLLWLVATSLHPGTPIEEALTVIPMLYVAFAIVHAWVGFGLAGMAAMVASCWLIAFAFEWLSIHSGFPFGFYEHGDVFGAKIAEVPPFIPLGYFAITYPAWIIAKIIIEDGAAQSRVWTPAVTALIATGFDAAGDAIGATVHGYWRYASPTGLFGVPLTNYLGWLLTCATIGLAFALIAPRRNRLPPLSARGFWAQPIAFWIVMALQFALPPMLALIGPAAPSTASVLVGGRSWRIADVYEGAAVVAILMMLPPAILALARLGLPARANRA